MTEKYACFAVKIFVIFKFSRYFKFKKYDKHSYNKKYWDWKPNPFWHAHMKLATFINAILPIQHGPKCKFVQSINYVDRKWRESNVNDIFSITLCSKLVNESGGAESQNYVNVVFEQPFSRAQDTSSFFLSVQSLNMDCAQQSIKVPKRIFI